LVSVILAVALMLMASPAWAVLLGVGAEWEMNESNETEGPMIDSSGNGNNGAPKNVLRPGDGTYVFNGSITNPSRVEVPDADSLDPKESDITLTASVRVGVDNTHQMDDDSYDIVRKGFVTTDGGDYKMEIKRVKANPTVGKLHCFFRGTDASGTDTSVARIVNLDVVDGSWHTLKCVKTDTSVTATVDGGRPFTTTGSAGSIANASNVMVGAKTVTLTRRGVEKGDDVFDGSMDFVSIEINQPDIAQ
jgi:hypothetical protein